MVNVDLEVDASGLSCPLPLLKAKQALNRLAPGQVLRVVATDAGSVRDFKAFTDQSGDELLESSADGGSYVYLIRKAPTAESHSSRTTGA